MRSPRVPLAPLDRRCGMPEMRALPAGCGTPEMCAPRIKRRRLTACASFVGAMKDETEVASRPSAGESGKQLLARRNAKKRGEWVEMAFMHKASGLGFGVAKPYGDSERYDFILSSGKCLWRVQVKSTSYGVGGGYCVTVQGRSKGGRVAYTSEEIDILAAYIVLEDIWYMIPVEALQATKTLGLYPAGARKGAGRFEKYREA